MTERRGKAAVPKGSGDWMDEMQGDSETQRILKLWKGRRFLKRLRQWCGDADRDGAREGGRKSWPRK